MHIASAASDDRSHVTVIEIHPYYPPGVSKIIGSGTECFIGLIDNSRVLKYPRIPGNNASIEVEARLLTELGSHPRIVNSYGLKEHGLLLQYAPNGNLCEYITSNRSISLNQKLRWCKQAAEAVNYIHQKRVIHCDISVRNFLLDDKLDLLLADFQGMLKSPHGETLLDGLAREATKSSMPRVHGDFADVKTDIFALGSAIYFLIMGHEPFPELDDLEDEEEIECRFQNGDFPSDDHLCSTITDKCWRQLYESAEDIILNISELQASKKSGEGHEDN